MTRTRRRTFPDFSQPDIVFETGLSRRLFLGRALKKTNPIAAVIVLVSSPPIGSGCDLLYDNVLADFAWVRDMFGATFNFLYRVFLIFLIGSGLIAMLSHYFNRRSGQVDVHDMTVFINGIGSALLCFSIIQLPVIGLVLLHVITPKAAVLPAALLTFGLFWWYMKWEQKSEVFYQADSFYASLLIKAMMWIMYYFA